MSLEVAASLGRALLFLGIPLVLLIFVGQWFWMRTCDRNIQILVAQQSGAGVYTLASKDGNKVTIHNPTTDEDRVWPLNELATIGVPYPGLGFIPRFLQKEIRLTVLNEGDWEPMLNRNPHRKKIASPDIVDFLQELAKSDDKLAKKIQPVIENISTGPTREMIANPAVLGDLMRSSVMKALATVSTDLMEQMKRLTSQLARVAGMNPTVIYALLGLNLIATGFLAYKVMTTGEATGAAELNTLTNKVNTIATEVTSMSSRILAIFKATGAQ